MYFLKRLVINHGNKDYKPNLEQRKCEVYHICTIYLCIAIFSEELSPSDDAHLAVVEPTWR